MENLEFITVPVGRWLRMDDGSSTPGWYGYRQFWEQAVATAPDGSVLVEIGVFCGRSLIDIVRMVRESGKSLTVVGVDTFRGSREHTAILNVMPNGALPRECWLALQEAGVLDDVTLMTCDSVRAAKLFIDRSIHAAFIDADHSAEAVEADIAAWKPKIAFGGMLGGDDYGVFPGVKEAVENAIPYYAAPTDGRTWWSVSL